MQENTVRLIPEFPNFNAPGFDLVKYNRLYREENTVIHARSKNIYYEKHRGCLSLKLAFKGNEYYLTDNTQYAVNDSNFLILNNNTEYASFIDSDIEVESFALNFSEKYVSSVIQGLLSNPVELLNSNVEVDKMELNFVEQTYLHQATIFPLIMQIHSLVNEFEHRNDEIVELYNCILVSLLQLNKNVRTEINDMSALKPATREELYKRLNYARDFIEACYDQNINLNKISAIACLNREYFIRQFKILFGLTPTQYLIKKRMEAAKKFISNYDISISEVCQQVGYSDLTSFGKLFKKYFHCSPDVYRKGLNHYTTFYEI